MGRAPPSDGNMNNESSETEDEQPRYLLPEGCSDLIDVLHRGVELRDELEEPEEVIEF